MEENKQQDVPEEAVVGDQTAGGTVAAGVNEAAGGASSADDAARKPSDSGEKFAKVAGQVGKAAGKVAGQVAKTVADWSVKAYEKGGELYEQGKLELKIKSIEGDIGRGEREIGKSLYNLWANGRIEDRLVHDFLGEKLEEMAKWHEEKATTEELLRNMRMQIPEPGDKGGKGNDTSQS